MTFMLILLIIIGVLILFLVGIYNGLVRGRNNVKNAWAQIEVQLTESYIGQTSTDASGIGEAAGIISAGAAIGNAVYNATGVRIRQLPMTPAVVLAALNQPQPSMEAL